MANEYINKVIVDGQTRLDLTGDTVTPDTLLEGFTAHDASGAPIVGQAAGGGGLVYDDSDRIDITWDGDTTGRDALVVIDDLSTPIAYKVSDNIYGADDLIGATVTITGVDSEGEFSEEYQISQCFEIEGLVIDAYSGVFSGRAGAHNDEGLIFFLPSDGTYFLSEDSFTVRSLKNPRAKLVQGGEDVTQEVSDLIWATINIPNANGVSF